MKGARGRELDLTTDAAVWVDGEAVPEVPLEGDVPSKGEIDPDGGMGVPVIELDPSVPAAPPEPDRSRAPMIERRGSGIAVLGRA